MATADLACCCFGSCLRWTASQAELDECSEVVVTRGAVGAAGRLEAVGIAGKQIVRGTLVSFSRWTPQQKIF